jgi:hypothetical protein
LLKSHVALNELKPNSTDIMCSSIINKYINRLNQYESLSLVLIFSITLKKNSKHHKPRIIKFVNYNKYENIEN